MKPLLIVLILTAQTVCAFAVEPYIGHWRSGMKADIENGGSIQNVTDLYLNSDGSFRWYMKFALPEGKSHIVDKIGKYRIEGDQLLLFYETSPDHAQIWRFSVEGGTFWLIAREGTEKIPYRRMNKEAEQDGAGQPPTRPESK